jgi:hypothetical protein
MNTLETLALIGALAAVTILPRGEDNPPAVVRTESHREWVAEQCARHDLDETERTACRNYFGANK